MNLTTINTPFLIASILSIAVLSAQGESMYSSGPSDGLTGAPGEGLCTNCHSGSTGDGSVAILGVPDSYLPNVSYTITVELQDQGQQRWGFELTAVDASGDGAGSFFLTDPANVQHSDNAAPSRDYMKHTSAGTYSGTANGPVTWSFEWIAPGTDIGSVTFYVAGLAANGNHNTSGDYLYTNSKSSSGAVTQVVVPASSWTGKAVLLSLIVLLAIVGIRSRRLTRPI